MLISSVCKIKKTTHTTKNTLLLLFCTKLSHETPTGAFNGILKKETHTGF